MNRKSIVRCVIVFIAMIQFLGGSGCARDRTLDDWRRERAEQELAKLAPVSGVYSGDILLNRNGAKVGTLVLNLEPSTRLGDTTDRTGLEQQAVLRGQMILQSDWSGAVAFQSGFFDPERSNLRISVPGQASWPGIELSGHLDADSLTGSLETQGYPESGGHFTLNKIQSTQESALQTSQALNRNASLPSADSARVLAYRSTVAIDGNLPQPVSLVLTTPRGSAEDSFLDPFLPLKTVDVSLALNSFTQLSFPHAQWDQRTGTLMAQAAFSLGSVANSSATNSMQASLQCKEQYKEQYNEHRTVWQCRYANDLRGVVFEAEFQPVDSEILTTTRSPLESVVGRYGGELVSHRDHSPLGHFEIELESRHMVGPLPEDFLRSRAQPNLAGTLIFQERSLRFSQGFYDPVSGQFLLSLANSGEELEVRGSFLNGSLTGRIEAQGYPEYSGDFSVRLGVDSSAEGDSTSRVGPGGSAHSSWSRTYSGSPEFRSGGRVEARSVQLIMSYRPNSAEQSFLDLFLPAKSVDLALVMGGGAVITIPNSRLDLRTASLTGRTMGNGTDYPVSIECHGSATGTLDTAWNCRYVGLTAGVIFNGTFNP